MSDDPRPIRADAGPEGVRLDRDRLARKLAHLPPGAPVVAMIHGWRYAPGFARDCPHGSISSITGVNRGPQSGSGGPAIDAQRATRQPALRAVRRARANACS